MNENSVTRTLYKTTIAFGSINWNKVGTVVTFESGL